MNWTPAKVKSELPDVEVVWNGKKYQARVSGRLLPFAQVTLAWKAERGRKYMTPIMGPHFEFAWETIAGALNNGRTLRA
jgi:hypothetical protein